MKSDKTSSSFNKAHIIHTSKAKNKDFVCWFVYKLLCVNRTKLGKHLKTLAKLSIVNFHELIMNVSLS
ncbi:hypothetical protein B0181_05690 [Moraxella caviae]|uniref:Uncharacterized protein n=1 Tax=Moraxella caviae TaxID=34060 RepID=A0A1T0A2I2_9GAMM|nr:hypothetical protein B0181_05690 [Moraxella caviae]